MGRNIDPMTIDFAALHTLRVVHARGSFSRAAEQLGVTQSTVSYAIDRLRRAFQDPLFVRQGGRIVATERCQEIVATAARLIDEFTAASEPKAFDPAQARNQITLSCNYYERITLIPGLMKILRTEAPGLRVNILSSAVRGKEQLDRGESEMLIGPIRIEGSGYFRRRILSDHYVCVMAADAAPVQQPLTMKSYLAVPHVVVTYGGTWRSRYLVELEARNLHLNDVMQVPSPAALPETLAGTDLISTVPMQTARAFGDAVQICQCPVPAPFDIDLYWHARTHDAAMFKWLRAQLVAVATALSRTQPTKV